ncbi:MAG: hypothetical protein EZS28_048077, partial [Streblomastix strix]
DKDGFGGIQVFYEDGYYDEDDAAYIIEVIDLDDQSASPTYYGELPLLLVCLCFLELNSAFKLFEGDVGSIFYEEVGSFGVYDGEKQGCKPITVPEVET